MEKEAIRAIRRLVLEYLALPDKKSEEAFEIKKQIVRFLKENSDPKNPDLLNDIAKGNRQVLEFLMDIELSLMENFLNRILAGVGAADEEMYQEDRDPAHPHR